MKTICNLILAIICTAGQIVPCLAASDDAASWIYPTPREISATGRAFALDDQVTIAVPGATSKEDLFLARFLTDELGDRFGLHLKTERAAHLGAGKRMILMGSISNPLVKEYCAQNHIDLSAQNPGAEGYVLQVSANLVLVAGSDDQGAFYGLQSLRQLVLNDNGQLGFRGVRIRDWPDKRFRGVKLYLPGRNNIPFFKTVHPRLRRAVQIQHPHHGDERGHAADESSRVELRMAGIRPRHQLQPAELPSGRPARYRNRIHPIRTRRTEAFSKKKKWPTSRAGLGRITSNWFPNFPRSPIATTC